MCESLRYFVTMVLRTNKIFLFALTVLSMVTVSVPGFAQNKIKSVLKKENAGITIGFQSGKEILFSTTPQVHNKQNKTRYGSAKSLVIRKPINAHFKLETMLGYTSIQNNPPIFFGAGKINNYLKPSSFSLPVTIEYYFLPEKNKLRPFCGAGFQCNCPNGKNNNPSPLSGMDVNVPYYNSQADTKYITILFTQGVTFEVNTKIEITQSIHFMPENSNNAIGVDLGIGFKIP